MSTTRQSKRMGHRPIPKGLVIEVTRRPGKPSIYTAIDETTGRKICAGNDKWQVLDAAILIDMTKHINELDKP